MAEEQRDDSNWGRQVFLNLFRRQIQELEVEKTQMLRRGWNPDDSDELRKVLIDLNTLRKNLDALEAKLQRTDANEG